jgi:hypothetical protein
MRERRKERRKREKEKRKEREGKKDLRPASLDLARAYPTQVLGEELCLVIDRRQVEEAHTFGAQCSSLERLVCRIDRSLCAQQSF